jgi:hypothetical protein
VSVPKEKKGDFAGRHVSIFFILFNLSIFLFFNPFLSFCIPIFIYLFYYLPDMTFKDRTNEFHSVVDRIRNRSQHASSTLEKRALLSSPSQKSATPSTHHHPRSEFSLMASEISRNITSTASKLEKLTKRK